jgi:tetratricopeptide (TPR) repeat protein
MIDFKSELKNYKTIDLEKLLKTTDLQDNLKNSILLYNKALVNINVKSEDIAIIELKKAISLNPDFCEAINLLGILYACTGEYAVARNYFTKVLANDKDNEKALEYIKYIDSNFKLSGNFKENQKIKKETAKEVYSGSKKSGRTDSDSTFTSIKPALSIRQLLEKGWIINILCFAAGMLVFFLISLGFNSKEAVVITSKDVTDKSNDSNREDFEQKYNKLNEENKALLVQLDELKKNAQKHENLPKLLEIDKLVMEKKYVDAADMLVALQDVEFSGIEKEKFDSLRTQTMEKAANELYTQGRDLYKKKQYKEALEKFDKVTAYVSEWKNLAATIYYKGVCYVELNNKDKALEAFNEVITKHPSSSYVKYSQSRLAGIK